MESGEVAKSSSPKWKRPDEVMKFRRLKQKKRALSARINGNDNVTDISFSQNSNSEDSIEYPAAKKRNPFVRFNPGASKASEVTDESGIETDFSSDTTLFQLLNQSQSNRLADQTPKSFANVLKHLNRNEEPSTQTISNKPPEIKQKDGLSIPIDWSIKNRIRLMSSTPFSWSGNLKTCEQASSITGFVRCLDASDMKKKMTNCSLDTSSNAKFHQCCLYWQHPNIPWLQLFPRTLNKPKAVMISAQLQMAPMLLTEWTTAFKSLFQLVRTRQCPYFYLIANHFYCLFQAAGIAGILETHAIISHTTRGFRKMLDDEGVQYTMPLKKKRKSNEFASDSENSQTLDNDEFSGEKDDDDDDDDDDDWLESMGLDAKEMKKMAASQKAIERARERKVDGTNESLLLIEGVNVQAFFNVLLNCKSCVASTGPFAGIPPTLIAPTAFSYATLRSCKIRDSMVHVNGSDFYSIQIEGPVLPLALRKICMLLEEDKKKYSASLSTVKQSLGFTYACRQMRVNDENRPSTVFVKENLSDCGMPQVLIDVFCEDDPEKYDVIEKIDPRKEE